MSRPSNLNFFAIFQIVSVMLLSLCQPTFQIAKYDAKDSATVFQKIIIDKQNGDLLVAGRNTLYMFDQDLDIMDFVETGPVYDGADCDPALECPNMSLTNNDARVLQIDPRSGHLLFCGSVKQGLCTMYSLRDLGENWGFSLQNRVNYIGGKKDVVAFFGRWGGHSHGESSALYVGVPYDGRPLTMAPKAIAALRLQPLNQVYDLKYVVENQELGVSTSIDIDPEYKSSYIVDYIYGFQHGGFTYFVTVQRENTNLASDYVTKLVRVCENDVGFYSYTEVQLSCKKQNGVSIFFNIAKAAYLGPVGKDFMDKFDVGDSENVLFLVFGKSGPGSDEPLERYGSGLCMYEMSSIRRKFTNTQKDCYNRRGRILPWINSDSPRCMLNVSMSGNYRVYSLFSSVCQRFEDPQTNDIIFNCVLFWWNTNKVTNLAKLSRRLGPG